MVEVVEWNGARYRRYPESSRLSDRSYFRRTVKGHGRLLHRDVWEAANGPIPGGCHIHHVDGDPGNNDIANLQCVHASKHAAEHLYTEERLAAARAHLDAIRGRSKAWHASPEGLEAHRRIGAMAYRGFVPQPKQCAHCANEFTPRKIGNADVYCSNACKSGARRASGVDNVTRVCASCGASFSVNRYSKSNNCSKSCAARARGRTMRARI